jgi:hypothetical protein
MDSRRAYSAKTLADRWDCSEGLVRNLVKQGKLTPLAGFKPLRITAAEVDRYEGNQAGPDDTTRRTQQLAAPPETGVNPSVLIVRQHGWPIAMRKVTAAAYLDLSELAFMTAAKSEAFPPSFKLGGKDHWHRIALDEYVVRLAGAQLS